MATCPDEIIELLPWYANQTLDATAKTDVERHLDQCPACRRRLENLRALQGALVERPQEAVLPHIETILDRLAPQPSTKLDRRWMWALIVTQARLIRRDIWIASTLVMALGTLITMLSNEPPQMALGMLPLVWAAPIVAAAGVAFLYGPSVAPAIEIELTTPVSPHLILLVRLMLTFGFDLALGLTASVVLALTRSDIPFWPLVSVWLAPMAFLSALAFLLTVLTADPNVGFLVSLGLWAMQSTAEITGWGMLWFAHAMTAAAARPWLWILALLLGGLALWAGGREDRWIRGLA